MALSVTSLAQGNEVVKAVIPAHAKRLHVMSVKRAVGSAAIPASVFIAL
jgi:hypothetical protein